MTLRYPALFSCLMLCCFTCFGQYPAGIRSTQIRTNLNTLVDAYNPGIEVAFERRLTRKTSVQLTGALLHDIFVITPYHDFKGARFSVAKKWAFEQHRAYQWYYMAEFGLSTSQYGTRGRFAVPHKDGSLNVFNHIYHESFNVHKQTAFTNFRFGIQTALKRIVIDLSAGVGIKYKRTQHSGRQFLNGVLYPGLAELDAYQIADGEKNGVVGNMPFSIGVGYSF